mgnify:CR=1 FL=1|tara:strand:- start:72 stop:1343 length:1272 start_codon:yes stop_codon:yes gene_type:complete
MKRFVINGPTKGVSGKINISGAKNSCLPLMAASILFKKNITLKNIPLVQDVFTMKKLLISLGSNVTINEQNKTMKIINSKKHKLKVPYNLVSTMRAGVLTMGPLIGRYQKEDIYVAKGGGCSLGIRDINYHLSGFETLKAYNSLSKGYVKISTKNRGLLGSNYKFPKVTVTGSSNLIMASVLAKGTQILKNISIEPEVIDLITFLKNSGANIKFLGKRTIRIIGVKEFTTGSHEIIGDRIEAFSYLCVALITKGEIEVKNINPQFLKTELAILKKIGCKIKLSKDKIYLKSKKKQNPIKVKTGPYPNYATDNMPMLLAVLSKVNGKSQIKETIFSNRFMASPELSRMGAKIKIKKNVAYIVGQKKLVGADCISSDLRTTFAIILGALSAEGKSNILRIYHGLRGYSELENKLKKIGVKVQTKQ